METTYIKYLAGVISESQYYNLCEAAQDEAEEFLGQGFTTKVPEVLAVLQKYQVPFDAWGGPQANDSTAKMTKAVEGAPTGTIQASEIPGLSNFTNMPGDKGALAAIMKFKQENPQSTPQDPAMRQAYVDAMKVRDEAEGRTRGYGDVGFNFDNVLKGSYEPPVVFVAGGKKIVIGGRTRIYAALIQNAPIRVKELSERDIAQAFPQAPAAGQS